MRVSQLIITLIVAFVISACQSNTEPLPTLARIPPSQTPFSTLSDENILDATQTPTVTVFIPSKTTLPSASATITATITNTPNVTATMEAHTETNTAIVQASPTVAETEASATPQSVVIISTVAQVIVPPTQQAQAQNSAGRAYATPLPDAFVFGRSAGGRELLAYRFGTGDRIIMLVGGIHAGFEANTVELVTQLRDHFTNNLQLILPDVTLIIIPSLNPDGITYGRQLRGRFNGNGVDLNRNWGCGWSDTAFFRENEVNPGVQPFSEPETLALGSLIQRVQPQAVLFYHGAANGVFPGNCLNDNTDQSDQLALVYAQATGYPYGEGGFTSYPVTGSAPAWVDSQGIAAVDVELASATLTEFDRNLRGVLAVQEWVIGQ